MRSCLGAILSALVVTPLFCCLLLQYTSRAAQLYRQQLEKEAVKYRWATENHLVLDYCRHHLILRLSACDARPVQGGILHVLHPNVCRTIIYSHIRRDVRLIVCVC
jgi:hypothetical protein